MAEIKKTLSDFFVKLKADKKALFTVVLGLSGIFLILLSEVPAFAENSEIKNSEERSYTESELCREVEKMLSQIKGAGDVSVMLTYENSGEKIYATDNENDTSSENQSSSNYKHIIVDGNNGEEGLVIKELYPRIRGVAVVCSGGDDPQVQSNISSLLSALFDIGSNRISIAPRADKE